MAQGVYIFRADYQGNHYYSNEINTLTETSVGIDLQIITVSVGINSPVPDIPVYVFNSEDVYLQIHAQTDSSGLVSFDMAAGNYKFRADYLGSQYWSQVITTPAETSALIDIDATVVTVQLSSPVSSVPVYAFTDSNTYLGISRTTGESGSVSFTLSAGSYKFRADYQKSKYWSSSISVPTDSTASINLNMAFIGVTLSDPVHNVPVYVFTGSGSYTGLSQTTDSSGQVSFDLAEGNYTFRADYQKNQYWSNEISAPQIMSASIELDIVTVTVCLNGTLEGIPVYVFNDTGTYLGMSGTTDARGCVFFDMAAGSYKFRADYEGSQYFSDVITTPGTASTVILLPGQTPPPAAVWTIYENNPILHPSDLPSDMQFADLTYRGGGFRSGTSVMYDEGVYKMWIAGRNNVDNKERFAYATSPNGIDLTFVRGNAGRGAVYQDVTSQHYHVLFPCVIKDGSIYKMWYNEDNNGHARYNYATSNDGIVWNEYGTILSYTDADRLGFEGSQPGDQAKAFVLKEDDGTYSMWYTGYDGNFRLGYATSQDGINWTRIAGNGYGGCVLDIGTSDKFDYSYVRGPTVIKDEGIYKMWYYGNNLSLGIHGIGFATSPDGINWTKEYDPDGAGGRIKEFGTAGYPTVIRDGLELKMWYRMNDGTTHTINYAYKIE